MPCAQSRWSCREGTTRSSALPDGIGMSRSRPPRLSSGWRASCRPGRPDQNALLAAMFRLAVASAKAWRVDTVIAATACSFAVVACAPRHTGTGSIVDNDARAASAFSVVVQALIDSSRVMIAQLLTAEAAQRPDARIAVDPRPLRSPANRDPESVMGLVEAPGFEDGREVDILTRLSDLARLGIDTTSLLRHRTCPSVGAISPPGGPLDRSGCPSSLTVVAAVGRTNGHATRDTIPAVVYIGDSRGVNALFTSYVLDRTTGRWRFVGKTPSVVVE